MVDADEQKRARDNFSEATKTRLAAEVGYRCSLPGCGATTIGPNATEPRGTSSSGVAAHITAAAPGGPRFDATLTAEQRSSHENGIHCCARHGRLIDNDLTTYPEPQLRAWKAQAIERQKRAHSTGQNEPDGRQPELLETAPASTAIDEAWLAERAALRHRTERIHVVGCNVYLAQTEALRLYVSSETDCGKRVPWRPERSFEARYLFEHDARCTVIRGTNGSGKSSVLRMLAAHLVEDRRVLYGALSEVARRMSRGDSFLSALGGTTCEGRYNEARFAGLLAGADALCLDGLDETAMHRAAIVDELTRWRQRFPGMRLVVTDRSGPEATSLLSGFLPFTLALPKAGEVGDFVERVAIAMGRRGDASTARRRVDAAISARPELGTPLLLGFLTALAVAGDDELAATPARLYERVLTLMARSGRVDRRYTIALGPRDADAVLDELAWARHVDRQADHRELMARIVKGLEDRGLGGCDPPAIAEQGIAFWDERGIIRRVLRPQRDDLELVHATFQDFAAARRLSRRDGTEIARFAAAASSAEDMAILSVAASLGASAEIVDAIFASEMPDPERVLACARAVVHAALPEPTRTQLADALITLIGQAGIPTHVADAGEALAELVDAGRVDVARTYTAVGDHDVLTDEARRLAVLRVRVACVCKGAAGTVSAWISDQLARRASFGRDFKKRSFSAWSYFDHFVPAVVRVVALRESEPIAEELVRRLHDVVGMSLHAQSVIAQWAQQQGRSALRDVALGIGSEWTPEMDTFREQWRRDLEGTLGLLDALDLACQDVAGIPGDGSALALVLASSDFMQVESVDVHATFSIPEFRVLLAPVLKAWCRALDIDRRRLRGDIAEARRRGETAFEVGCGSPFLHLPATPARIPMWSRVDLADPELAPEALIMWMGLQFRTPVVLTMPILIEQRPAFIEAILAKLGEPTPSFLMWLSKIGRILDDARVMQAIGSILVEAWPPGAHHLLELLDEEALRRPEIRIRLIAALESEDVPTVEAAAGAVLLMDPIDPAALEAARKAFDRWTTRPRNETVKTVGRRKLQLRTTVRTPRGTLAPLVVLGPAGRARALLDDEEHDVRDIALACVRGMASCEADLEVITQSVRAADLIRTLIHRLPLRDHEVEWMLKTARREQVPEAARLALVDGFAEAPPEAIPDDAARSTLRALCEDGSVAIRDRALNGLRRRAAPL